MTLVSATKTVSYCGPISPVPPLSVSNSTADPPYLTPCVQLSIQNSGQQLSDWKASSALLAVALVLLVSETQIRSSHTHRKIVSELGFWNTLWHAINK